MLTPLSLDTQPSLETHFQENIHSPCTFRGLPWYTCFTLFICSEIWKVQNEFVFRSPDLPSTPMLPDPRTILVSALWKVYFFSQRNVCSLIPNVCIPTPSTVVIHSVWFIAFVDASFVTIESSSGIACILVSCSLS